MKNAIRIVKTIAAIMAAIAAASAVSGFVLSAVIKKKYGVTIDRDKSVAIIGGSDGPTAIFIADTDSRENMFMRGLAFMSGLFGLAGKYIGRKMAKTMI